MGSPIIMPSTTGEGVFVNPAALEGPAGPVQSCQVEVLNGAFICNQTHFK